MQETCAIHFIQTKKESARERGSEGAKEGGKREREMSEKGKCFCNVAFEKQTVTKAVSLTKGGEVEE